MKRIALAVVLLLSSSAPAEQIAVGALQIQQLTHFYRNQKIKPSQRVLKDAVNGTIEAAQILCISAQVDTMLAQWHRESEFDPESKGDPGEDSRGVAQTRINNTPQWRRFWKQKGIVLGPFDEVRTQVFCGVAEFYWKLKDAHGDVKEAVRRYNGSGVKARLYSEKVMLSRKNIFHRPYHKGEKQKQGC